MEIKKLLIFLLLLMSVQLCPAQTHQSTTVILRRLDSIRHSPSVARHFAALYFEITLNSADFFNESSPDIQRLAEKMRMGFANAFFRSVEAYESNRPVSLNWQPYYADSRASFIRCMLLGINAHLNGDIWQTLTSELSASELQTIRPYYLSYYAQLEKEYDVIYRTVTDCCPRARLLHQLSLGLGRYYGKQMLRNWLLRQMQLAGLYFTDRPAFDRQLQKLQRKMKHFNRLIKNITRR